VSLGDHGEILVDDHCMAADGVWAIGDVTGIMPFTHVAKYQGRIVADAILGQPRPASYDGIPRVVFADPRSPPSASPRIKRASRAYAPRVPSSTSPTPSPDRGPTSESPADTSGLLADRDQRGLIGAWTVAPLAGERIHQASLAIRARIPIDVLLEQVAQFPTYSEGYLQALEELGL
jgi:pyruvate/2-oxoglutarate dehydrogenase complex dihydrolipoamide dehydrogenase (E3) component